MTAVSDSCWCFPNGLSCAQNYSAACSAVAVTSFAYTVLLPGCIFFCDNLMSTWTFLCLCLMSVWWVLSLNLWLSCTEDYLILESPFLFLSAGSSALYEKVSNWLKCSLLKKWDLLSNPANQNWLMRWANSSAFSVLHLCGISCGQGMLMSGISPQLC